MRPSAPHDPEDGAAPPSPETTAAASAREKVAGSKVKALRRAAVSDKLLLSTKPGTKPGVKPKKPKPRPTLNASLAEPIGPLPPCPTSSAQVSRVRLKVQGRQRMCEHPSIHRSMRSTGPSGGRVEVPLVWSRPLVTSRRVFWNENPFETRKFAPFWAQLPTHANLSALLPGAGCTAGGRCDTCAVVGASGSLLRHRHGTLIDAHQVVIRPNWLKLKGYEHVAGARTDVNLFFGVEGMIDQFDKEQRKLPRERRAVGLVTPASDRSVASFFRHMARVRKNVTREGRAGSASGAAVYLMADDTYHRALGHLCHRTSGGCTWGEEGSRPTSRMRPSTGFFSVVLAMGLCRKVSLFGLQTDPCQPFHYYGAPKPACTKAIPKENDESVHWFEKEHAIYYEWEKEGRLTVFS